MIGFQILLSQEWHKVTRNVFRWKILQQLYISQRNISARSKDFHRKKINVVSYFPISLKYFHGKNNTWAK